MPERLIDPEAGPWSAYGLQLRRSRKAKGMQQKELAAQIPCNAGYLSRIETGQGAPTRRISIRCDEILETGGTLLLMWQQSKRAALNEGFPEYAELEARATLLRLFEVGVVPGLLQTEEYAAAWEAIEVQSGRASQGQADERVAFLLARQRLFGRIPTPTVHAVLDESCLRRMIGGPGLMAHQLRRLEEMALEPTVILQVVPFCAAKRPPFHRPVTLLTLADQRMQGYTESMERGSLERDRETVAAWSRAYDQLQAEALSPADSLALIRAVRKELVNMTHPIGLSGASWFKASYSGSGGQCVEVAPGFPGVVPVRDSKDPEGPALIFSADAFAAFVSAIKGSELPTV